MSRYNRIGLETVVVGRRWACIRSVTHFFTLKRNAYIMNALPITIKRILYIILLYIRLSGNMRSPRLCSSPEQLFSNPFLLLKLCWSVAENYFCIYIYNFPHLYIRWFSLLEYSNVKHKHFKADFSRVSKNMFPKQWVGKWSRGQSAVAF